MGLFNKTPEEKQLRSLCETLGAAAGQVSRGSMPFDYFTEVRDASRAEIASLYEVVARRQGPNAARRITKVALTWAEIWGGGDVQNRDYQSARAAKDLVREALVQIVGGRAG